MRETSLRRQYGLNSADYDALLNKQGSRCAICGEPETARDNRGNTRRLAVDHDHATGCVRGLLCHSCNTSLKWRFTPALLRRMADYLESPIHSLVISLGGKS